MEASRIVREIARREGISMSELSRRLGISRQALYKRLEGDMRSSSFLKCIEVMGCEIYYGKGKAVRGFD